jgi:hypothetical protein
VELDRLRASAKTSKRVIDEQQDQIEDLRRELRRLGQNNFVAAQSNNALIPYSDQNMSGQLSGQYNMPSVSGRESRSSSPQKQREEEYLGETLPYPPRNGNRRDGGVSSDRYSFIDFSAAVSAGPSAPSSSRSSSSSREHPVSRPPLMPTMQLMQQQATPMQQPEHHGYARGREKDMGGVMIYQTPQQQMVMAGSNYPQQHSIHSHSPQNTNTTMSAMDDLFVNQATSLIRNELMIMKQQISKSLDGSKGRNSSVHAITPSVIQQPIDDPPVPTSSQLSGVTHHGSSSGSAHVHFSPEALFQSPARYQAPSHTLPTASRNNATLGDSGSAMKKPQPLSEFSSRSGAGTASGSTVPSGGGILKHATAPAPPTNVQNNNTSLDLTDVSFINPTASYMSHEIDHDIPAPTHPVERQSQSSDADVYNDSGRGWGTLSGQQYNAATPSDIRGEVRDSQSQYNYQSPGYSSGAYGSSSSRRTVLDPFEYTTASSDSSSSRVVAGGSGVIDGLGFEGIADGGYHPGVWKAKYLRTAPR